MGSNREDGGCRNGVVYRASFLRNNDSRKVGYPIGFNAQRAMHIWDMKGRRRRAPLGHFFCATGALASRALPKPCRRRCALPAGFARFRGRVPWIVSLSPSLFFFSPPPLFPPSFFPIAHFPFPLFAHGFLPGSLLAFAFRGAWRAASKKFPAQPAGWLLGRRNLEPFALGMAASGRGRLPCFA